MYTISEEGWMRRREKKYGMGGEEVAGDRDVLRVQIKINTNIRPH